MSDEELDKYIDSVNERLQDSMDQIEDKYGKDWKHGEAYEKAQREQEQYQRQYQQYSTGGGFGGADFGGSDFSEFFQSMFGGGFSQHARGRTRFKGQDLNAELELTLRQAMQTHQQTPLSHAISRQHCRLCLSMGHMCQVLKRAF